MSIKPKRIKSYFLIFYFNAFISGTFFCHGQDVFLSGKVMNTQQENLPYANLIIRNAIGDDIFFSISDEIGQYQIILRRGEKYIIEISYLGYAKQSYSYEAEENKSKNFLLEATNKELDEVVLEFKIPVTVKKDTITYNTQEFTNGQERKLREILKKLPGIEVDRDGNVLAQGRKVTKVLVENNTFFTGNSKLAVNNIPADAVDQVQILDNYNKISFLKGLQDSQELALNIKLKKDKKKFTFGDVEAGSGLEKRYLLHPTVFYYSPKTNINLIGDINNVGVKSFTLNDYLEFNGGFGKLFGDIKGYLNLSNDSFSQFLLNDDFTENINRFGAFNLRHSIGKNTDINSFVIVNSSDTKTKEQILNIYNSEIPSLEENRRTERSIGNFFVLGKLSLEYSPNKNTDLTANSFVKLSNSNSSGTIITQSETLNNTFNTIADLETIDLKQNFEFSRRFSETQTISLLSTLTFQKSTPNNQWLTNESFLSGLIPLLDADFFDVMQQKENQTISFDFLFKNYMVLNDFNHIYTTVGTNLLFEDFKTHEEQILEDGTINDFSNNGFGNLIDYSFSDSFLGLEYKFLKGMLTVKSSMFYHNYQWRNVQEDNSVKNITAVLLPELDAEMEFNNSHKLRFRYNQEVRLPRASRLVRNFFINSFNSVLLGNTNLSTERFHNYSLTYYKFSLYRGFNLNTGIFYKKNTQTIKGASELEGINQSITYTMFNEPENSWSGNFTLSKKIDHYKFGIDIRGNYSEFFQLVNNNISKNISRSLKLTSKGETYFEKGPNLELGYTYQPSVFTTANLTNEFNQQEFFTNFYYDFLKDFQFKADFRNINYKNVSMTSRNTFNIANASLFYKKEESPWSIEVSSTNLFNTQFKRQNSFSDFLISDQTIFLISRIILLKLAYKF